MKPEKKMEKKPEKVLKFKKLAPLSCASVYSGGPCREEFNNYVREMSKIGIDFFEEPDPEDVFELFEEFPSWETWLIDKGYIEEADNSVAKCGDRFYINNDEQILACTDTNKCALINLRIGNRWTDSSPVNDIYKVTFLEFEKMCGSMSAYEILDTKH